MQRGLGIKLIPKKSGYVTSNENNINHISTVVLFKIIQTFQIIYQNCNGTSKPKIHVLPLGHGDATSSMPSSVLSWYLILRILYLSIKTHGKLLEECQT